MTSIRMATTNGISMLLENGPKVPSTQITINTFESSFGPIKLIYSISKMIDGIFTGKIYMLQWFLRAFALIHEIVESLLGQFNITFAKRKV